METANQEELANWGLPWQRPLRSLSLCVFVCPRDDTASSTVSVTVVLAEDTYVLLQQPYVLLQQHIAA